jgi:RNA polymerase sigma-70 factor (ECF subfamily)
LDWIEHIKTDADRALKDIYKKHRSQCLMWLGTKFSLPKEDCKEIFQHAVVILYDNVMKQKVAENKSSLKTYLFGIAKFKAYEYIRFKQKWTTNDTFPMLKDHVVGDIEDKLDYENKLNEVQQALSEMGDPCKSVLKLFYYQQLNMESITQLMGYKNADTTKNIKYKCIKRLRKHIFEHKEVNQQ